MCDPNKIKKVGQYDTFLLPLKKLPWLDTISVSFFIPCSFLCWRLLSIDNETDKQHLNGILNGFAQPNKRSLKAIEAESCNVTRKSDVKKLSF